MAVNPEWYYTANGGQQGPVTAADLKKLAQAGTIGREDLVWKEGMPNWVPAKNVKGLFSPAGAESGETKAVSQSGESKKAPPSESPAPAETPAASEDRPSKSQAKAVPQETPIDDADVAEDRPRRSRRDEDEEDRPRRSRRDRDDDDRPRRSSRRRDEDDDDDDRSRRSSRGRYDDDDDFDDYDDRPRRRGTGVNGGSGLGIASMICGILGLVISAGGCMFACIVGPFGIAISGIFSVVAVCLGFPALKTEGRGFGIAGLVTGFIGIIPVLLSIMAFIFGFAFLGMGALVN